MSQTFRKKLEVIEAIQFTGHNDKDCLLFCPTARDPNDIKPNLIVVTMGGEVLLSVGDWIVKNYSGSFAVFGDEWFKATYEMCAPNGQTAITDKRPIARHSR